MVRQKISLSVKIIPFSKGIAISLNNSKDHNLKPNESPEETFQNFYKYKLKRKSRKVTFIKINSL